MLLQSEADFQSILENPAIPHINSVVSGMRCGVQGVTEPTLRSEVRRQQNESGCGTASCYNPVGDFQVHRNSQCVTNPNDGVAVKLCGQR